MEHTLKTKLLLSIFFILISLVSCTKKLPLPGDNKAGLIAFPVVIKNTSDFSTSSFEYVLHDTENKEGFKLRLRPFSSRDFIISEKLTPGRYYFNKLTVYQRDLNLTGGGPLINIDIKPTVVMTVENGKISIPNYALRISQIYNEYDSFSLYCKLGMINKKEKDQYAKELAGYENADLWGVR